MLKLVIPSDGPARLVKAVQNYMQNPDKELTNLHDLPQELIISQNKPVLDNDILKEIPREFKDNSKWPWFIGGLLVGSFLNFFTVIVLVSIGILIANEPLPVLGIPPQEAIANVVRTIVRNSMNKDTSKIENKDKKIS